MTRVELADQVEALARRAQQADGPEMAYAAAILLAVSATLLEGNEKMLAEYLAPFAEAQVARVRRILAENEGTRQ